MAEYQVLLHACEVLTGEGIRKKDGRLSEEDLGRIEDGAVVYSLKAVKGKKYPDKIHWVGKTSDLPKKYSKLKKRNLKNKHCVMPGLIDCHTHLVFGGNRADEFARRCGGESYQSIAEKGGGIVATVRATREMSEEALETLAIERVEEALRNGVRTIEVKSGYGLSHESEIKILKVANRLKKLFPQMTFVTTYLGAHAFPKDQTREAYLKEILERTLPEVAKLKLAEFCDVFVDEGYFSLEEGNQILTHAKKLGMKLKIHADELGCTHSAELATKLGAASADHLLRVSDEGIRKLAQSKDTVAVLLPGTAFYLKAEQAPARRLMDAGAAVALSTDFNPGTCVTLSLPTIMTLGALYLGMTRSELFGAVTYNAAKALALQDRKGTLETGKDADFVVLPFSRFEELYYRFAWSGNVTQR